MEEVDKLLDDPDHDALPLLSRSRASRSEQSCPTSAALTRSLSFGTPLASPFMGHSVPGRSIHNTPRRNTTVHLCTPSVKGGSPVLVINQIWEQTTVAS